MSKMADQLGDPHALTVAEAELTEKTIRDLRRILDGLSALNGRHGPLLHSYRTLQVDLTLIDN